VPSPIVVEVYAPQPRPQELAVLIAACTRAAAPNECITSDVKSSDPPLGVAIVHRDGDRARIELGLRSAVNAEWSTRDLVFQPGDDELERYRAMGFAIGTLVAHQTAPPPPPVAADQSPAPPPVEPPPSRPADRQPAPTVPERRARAAWIDVAGSMGLALIPGPPRLGASLRAAAEIVPRGLFGVAETGYAERGNDPVLRVRWLSMALGVGYPLAPRLRSLGVDVRLSLMLEHMSLTAYALGRSAGDSRWKPGLSAAMDAYWIFAPPLAFVVSAATFIDPERSVVRIDDDEVGETPALGFSGFVGLRLRLR